MEENKQYGFFDQIIVSFFKPSEYKSFLPVKKSRIAGFILVITLFSVLLQYVIPFGAWDVSVGGLENLVTNQIPAFSLKDGTFDIKSPISFDLNGAFQIKADSSVDKYTESDLDEDSVEEILISKNNIIVKHSGMIHEVDLSKIDYTITNETVLDLLPIVKISIALTFVLTFLMELASYLVFSLFFGFICKGRVRGETEKVVTMGVAFAFAVYARAPFLLLGDINVCLGTPIDDLWVMIFGVFFTINYIFRAEMSYVGKGKKRGNLGED